MPVFTIEATYHLPVYRHRSYDAPTLAEACRLAVEDDDWSHEKHDHDSAGETFITGAWQGRDVAYRGPSVPVPPHYDELVQRKAEQFEVLLGLVKVLSGQLKPYDAAFWRDRALSAIVTAEAVIAGARDPA